MSDNNILIVDDEARIRRVIDRALDGSGHRTTQADSGAAALAALRANKYSLVFLDVRMPGEDGFQTAERLRNGEAGPTNQDVPIVFVTAESDAASFERSFDVGAHRYITKPFDPEEISAVVALLVSG